MGDDQEERREWLTWDVLWERAKYAVPWGAAILIALNETFIEPEFRPEVIPLIALFIAIPFAHKGDQQRNGQETSGQ